MQSPRTWPCHDVQTIRPSDKKRRGCENPMRNSQVVFGCGRSGFRFGAKEDFPDNSPVRRFLNAFSATQQLKAWREGQMAMMLFSRISFLRAGRNHRLSHANRK